MENKIISDLKNEIEKLKAERRYGLVWENDVCNEKVFPLIKEIENLSIKDSESKLNNYLIEGDNYHSLQVLQNTHYGKIDVIYIDPPYNTGNDFIYNDRFRDRKNNYRHSTWLSFMDKRLRLAKDLMSDNSVIYVSIDENEKFHLKLLMDTIFGEDAFKTEFIWLNSSAKEISDDMKFSGGNSGDFKNTHESVLVYTVGNFKFNLVEPTTNDKINSRITKKGNLVSELLIKKGVECKKETLFVPKGSIIGGNSEPIELMDDLIVEDYTVQKDTIMKGQFASKGLFEQVQNGGEVYDRRGQLIDSCYLTSTGLPFISKVKLGEPTPNTLTGFNQDKNLNDFQLEFDHPKPTDLIKYLIDRHPNKNATILDFFAGSGTTGQAVMELNEEDEGNRKYILCTNNEVSDKSLGKYLVQNGLIDVYNKKELNKFKKYNKDIYTELKNSEEYRELGIARSVTRERLKKVIEGYQTFGGVDIKPKPNNLCYMEVFIVEEPTHLDKLVAPLSAMI